MQQDWRKSHLGLLFVLALLLTFGALYQTFRFDGGLTEARVSLLTLDRAIGSLEVSLSDLRGAQTGYLAAGQSPDVWTHRTRELFQQMDTTLTELRTSSASADARARYSAGIAALANLRALDKRALDQIQNDQRFLAADIIYVEGLEGSERLRTELAGARSAETMAAEARMTGLSRARFGLDALAMGVVLIAAFYIARPARQPEASPAATTAQMLRDLPPPVRPATAPLRATPPQVSTAVTNLPDAAELCVDLARVIDSRDVPALLERAASVLDAKGVIIWTVDGSGTVLRPSLTHGYPSKVLTRLGALDVDADNVTSLSFRSMRPQMMPGATAGAAGAIAVPLMTASGCSGVLAAEIRDSKPAPEMIAITRILAAQFATLIAPGDLGATKAAQA